jgi:hypothetical protein
MASVKGKVSQEVSPLSYMGLNVYDDFFPNHLSGTFARGQFFICFDD